MDVIGSVVNWVYIFASCKTFSEIIVKLSAEDYTLS